MGNTLKYQFIVENLLIEYAEFWGAYRGVQPQVICDKERHIYALLTFGWEQGTQNYVHHISFHLEIIQNKIWIHQNNTEALIADELVVKGIPVQDIVLGFLLPTQRNVSGFGNMECPPLAA